MRVAEDLAGRMDFDTGHVRYGLDATAARLGVSRATVKRHVAVLRELGMLAWTPVRGTKANVRRVLGLPGYSATATVYAAVIPPCYDHAMGHELVGAGYTARIVIRCQGQNTREPVDNSPVDNLREPPSLRVVKESGKAEVESGFKNTSRKRASRSTDSAAPSSRSDKRSSSGGGARRSPVQVARDCWIAAQVRPRVNWTRPERNLRRLAYSLRPLIDQGMDAHDIAAELHSWLLLWRPERPAAYIRARLAQQAAEDAVRAAAGAPQDNPAMREWLDEQQRQADVIEDMFAASAARPRTDDDRRAARAAGLHDLARIVRHIEDYGDDDALDLYGTDLAARAVRLSASARIRIGAGW